MEHISKRTDNNLAGKVIPESAGYKGLVKAAKVLGAVCSVILSGVLLRPLYEHLLSNPERVERQAAFNAKALAVQGKCHEAIQSLTSVLNATTRNTALLDIGTADQCDFQTKLAAFQGIDDDGRIGEIAAANLITMHIHRRMWAEAVSVIQTKVKGAAAKDTHIQAVYDEMNSEVAALCRKGDFEAANALIETVSSEPKLVDSLTSLVSHYSSKQPCEGEKAAQPQSVDNGNEAIPVALKVPARQEARTNAFEDPEILRQLVQAQLRKGPDFFDQAVNIAKKAPSNARGDLNYMIATHIIESEWVTVRYDQILQLIESVEAPEHKELILEKFAKRLKEKGYHYHCMKVAKKMSSPDAFVKSIFDDLSWLNLRMLAKEINLQTQEVRLMVMQALRDAEGIDESITYVETWTEPADRTEGLIAIAKHSVRLRRSMTLHKVLGLLNISAAVDVLSEVIDACLKQGDYNYCAPLLNSYYYNICKAKSLDTTLIAALIVRFLNEVQNSASILPIHYQNALMGALQNIGNPWYEQAKLRLYETILSSQIDQNPLLPDDIDQFTIYTAQQCILLATKAAVQAPNAGIVLDRLITQSVTRYSSPALKREIMAIPGVDRHLRDYIVTYTPSNSVALADAILEVNKELGRDVYATLIRDQDTEDAWNTIKHLPSDDTDYILYLDIYNRLTKNQKATGIFSFFGTSDTADQQKVDLLVSISRLEYVVNPAVIHRALSKMASIHDSDFMLRCSSESEVDARSRLYFSTFLKPEARRETFKSIIEKIDQLIITTPVQAWTVLEATCLKHASVSLEVIVDDTALLQETLAVTLSHLAKPNEFIAICLSLLPKGSYDPATVKGIVDDPRFYKHREKVEVLRSIYAQFKEKGHMLSDAKDQLSTYLLVEQPRDSGDEIVQAIDLAKKVYQAGGDDASIMSVFDVTMASNTKGRMNFERQAVIASAVIKKAHNNDLTMVKLILRCMDNQYYDVPVAISGLIKDHVLAEFALECIHKRWTVDINDGIYSNGLLILDSYAKQYHLEHARVEWIQNRFNGSTPIKPYPTQNRVLDPAFRLLHEGTQQALAKRQQGTG